MMFGSQRTPSTDTATTEPPATALATVKTPTVPTKQFKVEKTFDTRKAESERIRTKYPDLIPVICERHPGNTTLPESTRRKYLVPPDITMGQFKYVIRKRIELLPDQALFVFVDSKVMSPTMATLSEVYREHSDDDGFLYMVYSGESTFG